MKFLNKLERRFGKYSIHHLPLILILFQVIGYTLQALAPSVLNYLCFDPASICRGQIWRLVSWVLMPPASLDIFTIITLLFYYWIARTLANTWGDFYFNVYIIGGILITDIGMMLSYPVFLAIGSGTALLNIELMKYYVTTYYVQTSILLAFAFTYPDARVLLYFFIPIKMSWLGIFYGIMLIYDFYRVGYAAPRLVIALSIVNFIIYFFSTRNMKRFTPKEIKRRASFRKSTGQSRNRGHRPGTGNTRTGMGNTFRNPRTGASGNRSARNDAASRRNSGRTSQAFTKIYPNGARHRCTICGRTEKDDDSLEFRFCSKCEGNYEYCQDHLFNHKHIKNGVPTEDPQ